MTSQEYWEQRLENCINRANKSSIKKVYKQAYKNIDKELTQLWLELTQKDEINLSNLYQCNRYRELQNTIEKELKVLGDKQVNQLQQSLTDTYIDTWNTMHEFYPIKSQWTIMDDMRVKEIVFQNYKGATFSDRVWDNMSKLKGQIENTIINTVVTGKDVRKASGELMRRMDVSYNDAKRITITETSRVFNESCRETAMSNGYSTYIFLAEKDDKTCDECMEFDGQEFDMNDTAHMPPLHPNSRSTILIKID